RSRKSDGTRASCGQRALLGLEELACQGDESPHRDDLADHAEEYGGNNFRLCGAALDSQHDHHRHGWNGRRQHGLADDWVAIVEPSQATQDYIAPAKWRGDGGVGVCARSRGRRADSRRYTTALRRAASRNHAALNLGVRFCVLKSTYTSPNRSPYPLIH